MSTRMLIDTRHSEETRVAVVKGSRVEDFDYESVAKKQLKGNIYLARVTRVEPSLQACFVEYGGNRHGFLAFSEIHPDYYQIPAEDREALLAEGEEYADTASDFDEDEDEDFDDAPKEKTRPKKQRPRRSSRNSRKRQEPTDDNPIVEEGADVIEASSASDDMDLIEESAKTAEAVETGDGDTPAEQTEKKARKPRRPRKPRKKAAPEKTEESTEEQTEAKNSEESSEALPETPNTAESETSAEENDDNKTIGEDTSDDAVLESEVITEDVVNEETNDSDSPDDEKEDLSSSIREVEDDDQSIEEIEHEGASLEEVETDTETESINENEDTPEQAALDEDEARELRKRRYFLRTVKRRYKIQEVIKRRQVLLIQVVKEERGNKGAALTTYLSLAGRFCVLMPNSTHSGGISRKISSHADRRRLKGIISSLNMPHDMGLIVRTAGMKRTKVEIKRDYDYMLRMWNAIRDLTLKSTAPALIYEEGNLIKRAIRDLYNKEIDEILVEGRGYRQAKDFMKMLMPSHASKIKHYNNRIPLFHRYQVEGQLASMYDPVVQLKSGGYVVINPTEALISIDVNSGRATKESSIEQTAINTNLEAAEEVARQLRLRDMAGLVVIDFIDMEDRNNIRSVERRMKEVLKNDRARIQVGKISSFGLMEMSRQRLRPNLLEAAMHECAHCKGSGVVPTVESAALTVLRELEEEGIRSRSSIIRASLHHEVAAYILNNKRRQLLDLEFLYKFRIELLSRTDFGPSQIEIEREAIKTGEKPTVTADEMVSPVSFDSPDDTTETAEVKASDAGETENASDASDKSDSSDDKPKRRRRRRRRKSRDQEDDNDSSETKESVPTDVESGDKADSSDDPDLEDENSDEKSSRRRRGRRGGRRRRRSEKPEDQDSQEQSESSEDTSGSEEPKSGEKVTEASAEETEKKPRRRGRPRKEKDSSETSDNKETSQEDTKAEKPKRRGRKPAAKKEASSDEGSSTPETTEKSENSEKSEKSERKPSRRASKKQEGSEKKTSSDPQKPQDTQAPQEPADPNQPKRKGWWQRTFG
ncbi:Rne/Rng family ribonuclease [Temperatibacter marinus]|uniref:Ribonuclease E n=1 Tax=Temperatibacter marinus TaxID=1456591 RepID=A0AA52EFR4_9PROT|nr:Rne/Rng family ribonuclease [Temperatibacter marinus]WND02283.1 Rne/Rng family ribonuclease [Temperatibacter marinus]